MRVSTILNRLPFISTLPGPDASARAEQRDAWERLILICNAGGLGTLAFASVLAIGDDALPTSRRILAIFLSIVLAAWYVFSVRSGQLSSPSLRRRATTLVVALVLL